MSRRSVPKKVPQTIDPRWQRRRLEIFKRDGFCCRLCQSERNTLHLHHERYIPGKEAWEYTDKDLSTLCASCHERVTKAKREVGQGLSFEPKLEALEDFNQIMSGENWPEFAGLLWVLKNKPSMINHIIALLIAYADQTSSTNDSAK